MTATVAKAARFRRHAEESLLDETRQDGTAVGVDVKATSGRPNPGHTVQDGTGCPTIQDSVGCPSETGSDHLHDIAKAVSRVAELCIGQDVGTLSTVTAFIEMTEGWITSVLIYGCSHLRLRC